VGTSFFGKKGGGVSVGGKPSDTHASGLNMAARAFSAPGYAGTRSAAQSRKDLGAAQAASQHGMSGPVQKSAATDAKGPRI
jgi:hypothetical protein